MQITRSSVDTQKGPIHFSPGIRAAWHTHWQGAAPNRFMVHIAVQQAR